MMWEWPYLFFITLLHSIWQSALLLGAYQVARFFFRHSKPAENRDLLLGLLGIQLLLSVITFILLTLPASFLSPSSIDEKSLGFLKNLSPFACLLYFLVTGYRITRMIMQQRSMIQWLPLHVSPAPAGIRAFTDWQAQSFQIGKKVTVWISDHIASPFTYGFLKPVILLPAAVLNQLSMEETESIIIHELNHIRNNDFLINAVVMVIESAYFFNPALLFMTSLIRLEREKDCDLSVLNFKYAPVTYAETLLKLARHAENKKVSGISLIGESGQLFKRISFIGRYGKSYTPGIKSYNRILLPAIACLMLITLLPFRDAGNKKTVAEKIILKNIPTPPLAVVPNQPKPAIQAGMPAKSKTRAKSQRKTQPASLAVKQLQIMPQEAIAVTDQPTVPEALHASYHISEKEKTVILEEEESGGRKKRKCYKLRLQNNRWQYQLIWTMTTQSSSTSNAQ